jgi:hypothetical protein
MDDNQFYVRTSSLLHRVLLDDRRRSRLASPRLRPPRVHAFVERHADRVHLADRPVEVRLKVPVRAQALADVADAAVLRRELDRAKVLDVVWD